jgi:hypothetical protein
MKTFTVFSFVLVVCLLAGCGGDDDDDDDDEIIGPEGEFLGFASMKAGSWAEYTSAEEGRNKLEFLGTDTYNGKESYLMEFETGSGDEKVIGQIWIDKTTSETVLFVMKQIGIVMKLDVSQMPEVPGVDFEEGFGEEPSGAQKVGSEQYTTPTGKTVEATIYRSNNNDDWISSEVPFGLVKSTMDGETVTELYDFGFSGAVRDISKEEAENAQSINFPLFPPGEDIPNFPGEAAEPDVPDNMGL